MRSYFLWIAVENDDLDVGRNANQLLDTTHPCHSSADNRDTAFVLARSKRLWLGAHPNFAVINSRWIRAQTMIRTLEAATCTKVIVLTMRLRYQDRLAHEVTDHSTRRHDCLDRRVALFKRKHLVVDSKNRDLPSFHQCVQAALGRNFSNGAHK